MKPTILKKIVNSLNLNRYYKDEFYKFLLGNGSDSNSEKIVCTLDKNIDGEINDNDLNKIFSSLDFINGKPEDIMDKFIIKWKIANNEILVSKCIMYGESFGRAYDDTAVVYKSYIFNSEDSVASISMLYKQSDMSFYGVAINNPYHQQPS